VPNEILGQLGNRIQHALRAYTPRDQKAVRTVGSQVGRHILRGVLGSILGGSRR